MRFDLTDLRLFLSVVGAGSITHGAANLGLSLAAASERLRDMELSGKTKLLDRKRRGVLPTPAGEALAYRARLILQQMTLMEDELGHHATGLRATIRLLANTAALTEFLPALLGVWLAAHPRIDIDLQERQSVEIAAAIRLGLADIGILSAGVDTSGLQLRPFAIDRLVVVLPRGHGLAMQRKICMADIAKEDFVGLSNGALQTHIEAHAANAGIRLRIRACMRTFEGICHLVANGVGVGIVPEKAAIRCKKSVDIAYATLVEPWATRQLSVCIRADADLTPMGYDLVSYLASAGGKRNA